MRVIAVLALAAGLAACGPNASELDGNLEVSGMEPAVWMVKIDRTNKATSISTLGARDITGELPTRSKGEKGEVLLTSRTPDGDFVMIVREGKCEDGLTEKDYHWSVTVDWKGETLKGCTGPAPLPPPKK